MSIFGVVSLMLLWNQICVRTQIHFLLPFLCLCFAQSGYLFDNWSDHVDGSFFTCRPALVVLTVALVPRMFIPLIIHAKEGTISTVIIISSINNCATINPLILIIRRTQILPVKSLVFKVK
mgnify:CR=1 FL=1